MAPLDLGSFGLPSHTRHARLGDVCEVNPRLRRPERPADDALVSFVPMAAVDEVDGVISHPETRTYREVAKGYSSFRDGDVIFAKITPCMENGKAAIASDLVGGLGFGSTEFHVLRPSTDVMAEFLFHTVRQPTFRRRAKAHFMGTAGQQRVPAAFLTDYWLPVPPLAEQRRIVEVLALAKGIGRRRRAALETGRAMVPALFYRMFGDPRQDLHGWPLRALGEVAEVRSGVTKGRRLDATDLIEVPYLRVANVQDGHLNLDKVKTIAIRTNERERYRVVAGDLLMTEGGDPDKLGRGALWADELPYCAHQNHVFRVRADRTQVEPRYLAELIGSAYGKAYFLRVAKRTTGIASINKMQLLAFPVLLPPLEKQRAFVALAEDMQTGIAARQEAAAAAERLAAALGSSLL